MIEKYKQQNNDWLNRLYHVQEKWCPSFNVDFFSAKMKSSQRSENTNNFFHKIMKTSLLLIQVIEFYEEKVAQMRQEETNEDFNCKNGVPAKVNRYGGILKHAANVYTLVLFKMFEDEFSLGTGLSCVETNHHDDEFTFSLVGGNSNRVHFVHFNQSNLTICCDCKLFETLGLLCCHALRVFLVNNMNMIPEKYISSRWRRDAKKRLTCANSCQLNKKSTHALRMSELSHMGYNFFDKVATYNEMTKFVKKKLSEVTWEAEQMIMAINKVENVGKESHQ